MGLLQALSLPPPKHPVAAAAGASPPAATHKAPGGPPHATKPGAPAAKHGAGTGKPPAGAKHGVAAKPGTYNVNNYGAFVVAFANESENWKNPPSSIDTGKFDPKDLMPPHRDLVRGLHQAVLLAKKDPKTALALWEIVQPKLRAEAQKAKAAGVVPAGIALALSGLDDINQHLFVAAAYHQAKREAELASDLEAPDTAQFAPKLQRAEAELMSAQELFQNSVTVAGAISGGGGFPNASKVKDIIDLATMGGDITAKLAEARKRGIATTTAELISKTYSATGFLVETSFEVGKKVIDAQKAVLLKKASTAATKKALEGLEKLGEKFEKNIKLGQSIAKVGTAVALIADGFRLFDALRNGDWSAAGEVLVDMVVDAAPLVVAEGGGAMITGIVAIAKAEIEAVHLAAAFIRWCRDETVRVAAEDFINDCNAVAPRARSLIASIEVMFNETNEEVRAMAEKSATQQAPQLGKDIDALASHVFSKGKKSIGGYPNVVAAMGPGRRAVTTKPDPENFLMLAEQIRDVFKGANAMAKYVGEHYKN